MMRALRSLFEDPSVRIERNKELLEAARCGNTFAVNNLIAAGIYINTSGRYNMTPLTAAARNGHMDIIDVLLAVRGILVNQPELYGYTALMLAAQGGHIDVVRALLATPGILVNQASQYAETAIMKALENGHPDIVTLLQGHGAVLPARLQTPNFINGAQSVHEVSVHVSVSRSAKNILQQYQYTTKQAIVFQINNLIAWLNTGFDNPADLPPEYKSEWLEPAKRCVTRLVMLNFIDQRSGISMQQALALVWAGINNPQAKGENKPLLNADEIKSRCITFLRHLYEIHRTYNLSDGANPEDYGGADRPTCVSGSFNKLIAALNEVGHQGVQIIFITSRLINEQVPIFTRQAFYCLADEHRKKFSQQWNSENAEAIKAECFDLLQTWVNSKLHEMYDDFNTEVPNLNQIITVAVANAKHTEMDEVMSKEREKLAEYEGEVLEGRQVTFAYNRIVTVSVPPEDQSKPDLPYSAFYKPRSP
jgi:hypothetical protein